MVFTTMFIADDHCCQSTKFGVGWGSLNKPYFFRAKLLKGLHRPVVPAQSQPGAKTAIQMEMQHGALLFMKWESLQADPTRISPFGPLLCLGKFVAFLSQIPPIRPVLPTVPTRKAFTVFYLAL